MIKTFYRILSPQLRINVTIVRTIARKRFYKSCNVIKGNSKYEVTLDQRKLKTPKGKIVAMESEPLALAVAAEWDSQKDTIDQSNMHLTGLCFTAIDNPENLTETKITEELCDYLENDTILYQASDQQDDLYKLQLCEWLPVSDWLCSRYHVNIRPTQEITGPIIVEDDRQKIRQYFLSHNLWSLIGIKFSIEALKSVSLGLACLDRFLSVEKAVTLSRLEEDFQSEKWGRVEWAHDLNEQSTRARVAAGTLFSYANSSSYLIKSKRASG